MATHMLVPTSTTIPNSSAQGHPHYVSAGLETGGMDIGGDNVVHGMEVRPEARDVPIPKKLKREVMGVEMVLKQTAEIGMVLIGMAALRGGAPPAPVERHLAIKAYSNLEGLAECVAPHDIVSKKSLQSLLQQFTLPKDSILPPVSSPTPTRDISTPSILASAAPISAEAVNISGKKSSTSHVSAKAKRAGELGVFKTHITCSKDSPSISSRDGKKPKKLARARETKTVQTPVDQRHVHQKVAHEVGLSKLDVISTASRGPASSYINSLITCDICKVLVNDTTSLLICDGCEAGFHVTCLQTNEVLDVPEKIWYCTKCLAVNGGRPRQAIYGPLRRGPGRPGSRASWILKSTCRDHSTTVFGKPNVLLRKRVRNTGAARGENLISTNASPVKNSKNAHLDSLSKAPANLS